ncbi:MAG TPA: hypothetical protein VK050_07865 [Flavobacteriaceae bacterium]|nr:hypothetical protein [Flavobacteriaceae bacterium]
MELNSNKVEVNLSKKELHDFLQKVENYEQLMPKDRAKFEVIRENAFVFGLKGMPEIALEIKDISNPDKVVLGAISDKLPFTLTADLEEQSENKTTASLQFEGKFNAMMAMMIKNPISKFLNTLTENMASLS